MRDARGAHAVCTRQFADEMRGCLAFHGRIRGEDQLLHLATGQPRLQQFQSQLLRTYAVEGRQVAHQHKITPGKSGRLFECLHIGRCLDHAQQAGIAPAIGAQRANRFLAERAADRAIAHPVHGQRQRLGQLPAGVAIALKQVKGHALRRLRTNTRQTTQALDEPPDQTRTGHASLARTAASCRAAD
jgi:hypothetical protein